MKKRKPMNRFLYHISFDQLADYVEGRLPSPERIKLDSHISACVICAGKVARLNHLLGLMRADKSEAAPPSLIQNVKRLFRARAVSESGSSSLRRRIQAVLHFDSMGMTRVMGVRSARPGPRQLLFRAETAEIDLRIAPAGKLWIVSGQVLGESIAGKKVVLHGDKGLRQADFNLMSEFVLPLVESGTYKMVLNLAGVDVEIEELTVGL